MINKVIIGILAFLLIISGGFGYYSYTLSQQINYLTNQVMAYQQEQAVRINGLSNKLATFAGEITTRAGDLESRLSQTISEIGRVKRDFKREIDSTQNSVATLATTLDKTAAKIDTLENKTTEVSGLSQSVINASEVYQRARQATVRINNGQRDIGSGFILDTEAHVVTAHHVIEDLSKIYVILPDGRVSPATTVGSSPHSDIAILKLRDNPGTEPPLLADSSQLRIGEPVVAIGSPFDLRETLTAGIISQTDRYVEVTHGLTRRWVANLIQFDAAANFGNSGGPLINSDGEIVGMVIARVDPDKGDGIYYAVAANKVKRVAADLIAQGFYDYPRIGINIANLTPQIVLDRGLATANGAWVKKVLANSPAEEAGIQRDDIIVAIDGVAIRDIAALTAYLGEHKSPGDEATLTLIRGGHQLEVSLTLGRQPRQ